MACRSKNLPIKYWQDVLPDALYSLRSLLCTATNETPHERLLCFSRHSTSVCSVASWLTISGTVYMYLKCHVRTSKTEPLIDEVELIGANSHYAHIRYPDGRETTVSTRHPAPTNKPFTTFCTDTASRPSLRESCTHTPCLLLIPLRWNESLLLQHTGSGCTSTAVRA